MKIGILTVYDSANYGAFLQAYASKCTLESMGHKVYFIKIRTEEQRKMVYTKKIHNIKEVYPYFSNYKFNIDKFEKMKVDIDKLEVIDINDKEAIDTLDFVMIGSDEIWNVNVSLFNKLYFFGNGFKRAFAFAASAGMADLELFQQKKEICDNMKNLYFIAARDENTRDIATKITGKNAELVCDPTLLLERDDYKKCERKIKEKYLLVYSYFVPSKIKMYLKKYAKKRNLKIVSVCTKHNFCDYNLNISPLEFSSFVNDAECVYTSTFHGTIFTLINHKKCIVMSEQKKVLDILNRFDMKDCHVFGNCTYADFERSLDANKDYDRFENKKKEISNHSKEVLASILGFVNKESETTNAEAI